MRFMLLYYPGPKAETGAMPEKEAIAGMMAYNGELTRAGVLLALDGLHPSAQGARVRRKDGKPSVEDGPFAEAGERVGGYWILQVKSREEAVQWAARCPLDGNGMIELRRIFEFSDSGFPPARVA